MSEPKRVTFETTSTASSKNLTSGAVTKDDKTIRLQLKLFEPNADSFPQFNFKKLCRAEKEKQKIPLPNGVIDPLIEEIDHDAVKLAQEFERKYGNSYAGSDSRSTKAPASTDKGSGYDENNGFIDDSEAYDEVIPDEMDTDRGGFYINSGHLQYRSKAPKRALSMSSDDESDSLSGMSATNENGNANKKQKLHEKPKIKKDNKKPDLMKSKEKPMPVINTASEQTKGISNNAISKEVKTTTVKDMLRAKRDNAMLKRSKSTSSATSDDSSSDSDSSDSSSDGDQSRQHTDEDELNGVENESLENKISAVEQTVAAAGSKAINKPTTIPIINGIAPADNIPLEADMKLLDGLGQNTCDSIHRFVGIAKNLKENLFDSYASLEMLYEVIKGNHKDSKTQIYNYLEKVLPYSKQRFEKEVNDIAIKRLQTEVRALERELQMEINKLMPGAEANYMIELKKIEQQRALLQGSDKPEQLRNPRRKFPWNSYLKSNVKNLLEKWQSLYHQRQIHAQTIEEYTDAYIADKLLPMWPRNWMKITELQSHFMPRSKDKDVKKSSNEHNPSKSQHAANNATSKSSLNVENMKDMTMVTASQAPSGAHIAEKRKSHATKESIKMAKNVHEKTTLSKTDRKHHHSTSDRSIATAVPNTMTTSSTAATSVVAPLLLSMPSCDIYSSKPATTGKTEHQMLGSVGASNNLKSKSININTNSNGSNFNRPSESSLPLDFISPTKKASDYSISQLISPTNHSSLSSMTHHHTPSTYNSSAASAAIAAGTTAVTSSASSSSLLLPTPSLHPVSSKNSPSSSSKSKPDSHHRPQSSSNGSNNNNFLHNNNNSKHLPPRPKDNHNPQIIDLSGETDEYDIPARKTKHHKHHKHNKKSKESVSTVNSLSTCAGTIASVSTASNLSLPNPVQSILNQMHQEQQQATSLSLTSSANDEVDHNKIIHDLKELSASNSSRKSYDSILENQSEFKQHYNHYRVSSPPYDRKQDHFF